MVEKPKVIERSRKVEPGQTVGHTLHGVVIDWNVGWVLIHLVAVESFRYY